MISNLNEIFLQVGKRIEYSKMLLLNVSYKDKKIKIKNFNHQKIFLFFRKSQE